ncbi:MAG: hypothetical protein GY875_22085 [Gammaproteobacteria bacterium]|nr:hypothetical protein [Gammaproteobacteria bacterium]
MSDDNQVNPPDDNGSGSSTSGDQGQDKSKTPRAYIDAALDVSSSRNGVDLSQHKSASILRELEWEHYLGPRRNENPETDSTEQPTRSGSSTTTPAKSVDQADLTGLAISGGGIRSATLGLGVLQVLAKLDLLRRFDYLSTVSGGGYIGGSLSFHSNREEDSRDSSATHPPGAGDSQGYDNAEGFVYGTNETELHPNRKNPTLAFLRSRGKYLTPSKKLNSLSFTGVILRAMGLNLLVWLPTALLMMAALQRVSLGPDWKVGLACLLGAAALFFIASRSGDVKSIWAATITRVIAVGLSGIGTIKMVAASSFIEVGDNSLLASATALSLDQLIALMALMSGLSIILIELTQMVSDLRAQALQRLRTLCSFVGLIALWAALVTIIAASPGTLDASCIEQLLANPIGFFKSLSVVFKGFTIAGAVIMLIVLLSMPVYSLATYFADIVSLPERFRFENIRKLRVASSKSILRFRRGIEQWVFGVGIKLGLGLLAVALLPLVTLHAQTEDGAIAFVVGTVGSLWKLYGDRGKELVSLDKLAPIFALLLIYGLAIIAYSAAAHDLPDGAYGGFPIWYWISLVSLLVGYFVNLNYTGIGRYYRDRLIESFMPDPSSVKDTPDGPADLADRFKIRNISPLSGDRGFGSPYHLVNTHAVLVDSDIKRVCQRGGDSFILSPLYCGSSATGWRRSDQFMNGDLTLASAVAASAAAVNPHTGVAGEGASRSASVSFLMALFNLRLGFWTPNPVLKFGPRRMHHFLAGLYELSPFRGFNEKSRFLDLSDGGHFENLALYELFRRKVKLIVALDGAADKDFTFGDLQNALARAEQDFGLHISFDPTIDHIVPGKDKKSSARFPDGIEFASRGYAIGTFSYASDPDFSGTLYYLKSTLIPEISMRIRGYKGAHPDFPDESTVDQFFDEDQFEAYRLLGYNLTTQLFDNTSLEAKIRRAYP